MAEHLARIIGTEEDRVNCPFYWKIGACRHGDQCSRSHYKPLSSQTLVLRHMYQNPPVALAIAEGQIVSDELADQAHDHFEAFYEEVFEELGNYGAVEEMVVCDNIGDHMIGNVYVKFCSEDDADKALSKLSGRFYAGRIIQAEFSPVTDFREARCRQFVDGQCLRGGYCNFMHMKHVPRSFKRKLFHKMYANHPEYKRLSRSRSPSNEKPRRGGGGGGGGQYHDDRYRDDRYRDDHNQRDDRTRYHRRGGGDRDRERGGGHDRYDRGYYHRNDRDEGKRDRHRERDRGDRGDRGERDRGGDREGDRYGRGRGERDRDERRGRSVRESSKSSGGGGGGQPRQTSEERRAMIDGWNREAEALGPDGSEQMAQGQAQTESVGGGGMLPQSIDRESKERGGGGRLSPPSSPQQLGGGTRSRGSERDGEYDEQHERM